MSTALGVAELENPPKSNEGVIDFIKSFGLDPSPLGGVPGEYFRGHNRYCDISMVVLELICEKEGGSFCC